MANKNPPEKTNSFIFFATASFDFETLLYPNSFANFSDSFFYTVVLISITSVTLLTGIWWFVFGVGEKRLKEIYDKYQ